MKILSIICFAFLLLTNQVYSLPQAITQIGIAAWVPVSVQNKQKNIYERGLGNERGAIGENLTEADYFTRIAQNENISSITPKPVGVPQGIDHLYLNFDKRTGNPRQLIIGETKFTNSQFQAKNLGIPGQNYSELSTEWIQSRLQYSKHAYEEISQQLSSPEGIQLRKPFSDIEIEKFPFSRTGYFYKENGRYYYYDRSRTRNFSLNKRVQSILGIYEGTINGSLTPRIRVIHYTVENGKIIEYVYSLNYSNEIRNKSKLERKDFTCIEKRELSPDSTSRLLASDEYKNMISKAYGFDTNSPSFRNLKKSEKINLLVGEMDVNTFNKLMSDKVNRVSFNKKYNLEDDFVPELTQKQLNDLLTKSKSSYDTTQAIADLRIKNADFKMARFFASSPFRYSSNFALAATFTSLYDLIATGSIDVSNTIYAGSIAVVSEAAESALLKSMEFNTSALRGLKFSGFSKMVIAEAAIDIFIDSATILSSYFYGDINSRELTHRLIIQNSSDVIAAGIVTGLQFAGSAMMKTNIYWVVPIGFALKYFSPFLYIPINSFVNSVVGYFDEKSILKDLKNSSYTIIDDWIAEDQKGYSIS